jgi:hypothetical protein
MTTSSSMALPTTSNRGHHSMRVLPLPASAASDGAWSIEGRASSSCPRPRWRPCWKEWEQKEKKRERKEEEKKRKKKMKNENFLLSKKNTIFFLLSIIPSLTSSSSPETPFSRQDDGRRPPRRRPPAQAETSAPLSCRGGPGGSRSRSWRLLLFLDLEQEDQGPRSKGRQTLLLLRARPLRPGRHPAALRRSTAPPCRCSRWRSAAWSMFWARPRPWAR